MTATITVVDTVNRRGGGHRMVGSTPKLLRWLGEQNIQPGENKIETFFKLRYNSCMDGLTLSG